MRAYLFLLLLYSARTLQSRRKTDFFSSLFFLFFSVFFLPIMIVVIKHSELTSSRYNYTPTPHPRETDAGRYCSVQQETVRARCEYCLLQLIAAGRQLSAVVPISAIRGCPYISYPRLSLYRVNPTVLVPKRCSKTCCGNGHIPP